MKEKSIKKRRTILFCICIVICIGITIVSVVYFSSYGIVKKQLWGSSVIQSRQLKLKMLNLVKYIMIIKKI